MADTAPWPQIAKSVHTRRDGQNASRRVSLTSVSITLGRYKRRYHKGPDVRAFVARAECRIRRMQLPPYCPQLTPIERLWAMMHQCVTHSHYYTTQKKFADAILRFFRETVPRERQSFRDKVSDNFRVLKHDKFRVLE